MSTFRCAECGADVTVTEPRSVCPHCGDAYHAFPPLVPPFPPLPAEVRATVPAPRPRILANRAQCRACGDVIESTHVHEFRSCRCGSISVDGGREYLRRLWKGGEWEAAAIELSFREGEPEPRADMTIGVRA